MTDRHDDAGATVDVEDDWGGQEAFELGKEMGQRSLDEVADAIRYEINVRVCCHRPADEIDALRWCLELVEDA